MQMTSRFLSPEELGEDTEIFNEAQAYKKMKGINKQLWEGKEDIDEEQTNIKIKREKRNSFF